ncbi:MAG: HAD family phosphatase [Clostridia bacterium]|nr:HAD family phosphatase [Clostridia bacterium]
MGRFDGILICTDLDGTLLRNDKTVSRENLDAIEYFKSEGGYFTFVTGRMPFFVSKIYETIRPNAPIGCINGGGLFDYENQRYLWSQTLPRDVVELVEYADKHIEGLGIQLNALDKIYFCKENAEMARFRESTGVPNLVSDYNAVDEPIGKIVFGDDNEEHILCLTELLDSHPRAEEFDFIRSEKTLYEILPKGVSKGSVLPRLAAVLGVDMSNTVAIGDYNNDVSMLRAAGLGIAVANATLECKAAADHVTVSNEEHAVARIISDLDKGILKLS